MNSEIHTFIQDILHQAPTGDKNNVIKYVTQHYALTRDRKVYYCDGFAMRFCFSQKGSFSNTVLSLSSLQKYDRIPFLVILVRKQASNLVYLANSTFLAKISHSSKQLTLNNIVGSFNGSDILKEYAGLKNSPENFDTLFAIHQGLDWMDNLERLVEATSKIMPKTAKFQPDIEQSNIIQDSIHRARRFIVSDNFHILNDDLNTRCNKCKEAILVRLK